MCPPLHSNTLVTIPEACARRSLPKDLPPLAIYTLSFLCCVCVAHGIVSNSLRQGQLSTFSWLQSTQSMYVIYTIQEIACQCLQHVGVDFLGRDVLRNGPHWSKCSLCVSDHFDRLEPPILKLTSCDAC